MKSKKNEEMKFQKPFGNFDMKLSSGDSKSLVIEGFANKAVRDRIGDLIPKEAWELENFLKNPIIFFNHNRDIPIGKAIEVSATDDGLKIKVRLSRSSEAPMPFIRDLVEEGILKTFSVGFDDHDSATKSQEGIDFGRAELLETSIVTIPMNQDSDFAVVASKAKEASTFQWKTKSYRECLEETSKLLGLPAHSLDKLNKEMDDEDEDEKGGNKDFQECVNGKIPKLIDEGMERDEAVATAINFCQEKGGCEVALTKEDYIPLIELADAHVEAIKAKAEESEEEEDKKESEDDEDEEKKKAKDPEDSEEEEDKEDPEDEDEKKQANQGDANGPTFNADPEANEFDIGQPALDLQKAQIAMAGETVQLMKAVLQELQLLNSQVSGKAEGDEEEEEEEEEKVEVEVEVEGEDEEEKPSEDSDEEEEKEEDEEDEEEKAALVQVEKNLKDIESCYDRLDKLMS